MACLFFFCWFKLFPLGLEPLEFTFSPVPSFNAVYCTQTHRYKNGLNDAEGQANHSESPSNIYEPDALTAVGIFRFLKSCTDASISRELFMASVPVRIKAV